MIQIRTYPDGTGFEVLRDDRALLVHSVDAPLLRAGSGEGEFRMYRGNFEISERLDELVALREFSFPRPPEDCPPGAGVEVVFSRVGLYPVVVVIGEDPSGRLELKFRHGGSGDQDAGTPGSPGEGRGGSVPGVPGKGVLNRFRIRVPASPDDHVYGCGEQFSRFDLRGARFPLWTSEQGVGRNKRTRTTLEADLADRCGGDYWWTFFPQPTFVSSARIWYHLETSDYAEFDFSLPDRHELSTWGLPERLVVSGPHPDMLALVRDLSDFLGRQAPPPRWTFDGIVLGMQGGTEVCRAKLERARKAGLPVAGIWAQDWEGINMTSFGQRLRWNWVWNRERYPDLDTEIPKLREESVRFLGYINCYVGAGWSLFAEASRQGYLARNPQGSDYLVDFGEFDAGIVDFTNPGAFAWYKGVIREHLVDFGLSGWMADFGEYLPTDAVLHSGMDATQAHNLWPALWARCNYEAVAEAGMLDEILFFMRAGFTGSQLWCPAMWAGDQNVDWSEDDGLPSVVTAALSLAMCGHGHHHSDIGGYTTLYGMRRTKELFMRWAEQAAFTPLMRTHEGNRPGDNWQYDSDDETLAHLARMVRLHVAIADYLRAAVLENSREGIPAMRPLFLHHGEEGPTWAIKDQYLLGRDLLVAPVMTEGAREREAYVPAGRWVHLWTGATLASKGSRVAVSAPLGEPPVWYRADSPHADLFRAAVAQATLGT